MSSDAAVASGPLALGITLFKNAYTLSAWSNKPGAAEPPPSILKHYRFTLFAKKNEIQMSDSTSLSAQDNTLKHAT